MQASGGLTELIDGPGAEWEKCEAALDRRGTPLPLFHRAVWARASESSRVGCSFIPIRAGDATCRAGFAIESGRSRALPGHRFLSVRQLGIRSGGLDETSLDAGLATLAARARNDNSVLRVTVESFALEADARARTAEGLRRNGFVQTPTTRTYQRTLVIDLQPDEDAIFAGFHKNARQGIRNVARYPVAVRTVDSVSVAPRLEELAEHAHKRTGGEPRRLDWSSIIRMSVEAPNLSRIAILERTDQSGPESILAFAWGCLHGEVAQYAESGSVRASDLKVSTSYALLWDLISWARAKGAHWFDLGGISGGTTHSDDALGGISDFKRRFSEREIEVGGQWELEPHPGRAAAARLISRSATLLRQTAGRMGKQQRGKR
jgi:peptidoglycan biosynthesis/recognition FemAB-like protein